MRLLFGAAVLFDLLSKVALLGSALALLGMDAANVTSGAALAFLSTAAAATQTGLRGALVAKNFEALCAMLVRAIAKKPLAELRVDRSTDPASALMDATVDVALTNGATIPEALSALGLLGLSIGLVGYRLGVGFLLVAILGAGLIFAILAPVRRKIRRLRELGWKAQLETVASLEPLLFGAEELRAMRDEQRAFERFLSRASVLAKLERRAITLGFATQWLPGLMGLVLLVLPEALVLRFVGHRAVEVGVLGTLGASAVFRAASSLESLNRGRPIRATLERFLGGPISVFPRAVSAPPKKSPSSSIDGLSCRDVSVTFDGATMTPERVTFDLASGGLAITGANGSGKTSLLLALLGLVPHHGEIAVGQSGARSLSDFSDRVFWLPQSPYTDPRASVGFHLGGMGLREVSDAEALEALRAVGLEDVLLSRARAKGVSLAGLPMESLSGGEQRRVMLARLRLVDVDLVLLDEPEAALDEEGRTRLRGMLEELAASRRVIVIAHDPSIIPDSFARLEVQRSRPRSTSTGSDGAGKLGD